MAATVVLYLSCLMNGTKVAGRTQKTIKSLEKTSKKFLTKQKRCVIIAKLSARAASESKNIKSKKVLKT